MVFGLEVLAVGRIRFEGLAPCLVASFVGDWTCTTWGVQHTHYPVHSIPESGALLVLKVAVASLVFALASVLFAEVTQGLHWVFARTVPWPPGRLFVGGLMVIALVWLADTRDYLGLGVPMIVQSFEPQGVPTWAFAWKLLFTAVTLGSGFKGGEVTPLFFIGAALGCSLAPVLALPNDFLAALGFVAVFAGAANTPLACMLMGMELFGGQYGAYLSFACVTSYIWSGHRGIYLSQLIDTPKSDELHLAAGTTLGRARTAQKSVLKGWLLSKLVRRAPAAFVSNNGEFAVDERPGPSASLVGVVRIYLSAGDRLPGLSWRQRLFARPLYEEIIDRARAAGLWAATAQGMTYGFSYEGKETATLHPDAGFVNTHIHVELVGPRNRLEDFMNEAAPLLDRRAVTFSTVEDWSKSKVNNQLVSVAVP
jgi:hypothetical protein